MKKVLCFDNIVYFSPINQFKKVKQMKATIIQVFDNEGNEIKNVSTEIVLNGETYVKKEADKQPDYSHLVGMWVKCVEKQDDDFTFNKWYKISIVLGGVISINDDKECYDWRISSNIISSILDLTNPLPYNPDTVVGLKELPNDGKTYAECLEDVVPFHVLRFIKGLFYEIQDDRFYQFENQGDGAKCCSITGIVDYTNYFRIHTPAKPIWETCRETMWEYDNTVCIETLDAFSDVIKQDESLSKLTKHLNALAYLSEVARRCNGDRVVDWTIWVDRKYTVIREWNYLKVEWYTTKFNQIAFLDKEARDYSFEVDKHIWNDYYGLPNE